MAAIPRWGQVIGVLLLVVFVALSVEAYFGPGLRSRLLALGPGSVSEPQIVPPRVFYEPGSTVQLGQKSIGSEGQDRVIQESDTVLLGATGQLVRLGPGGRVTDVQSADGASTLVANLGAWDRAAERLTGTTAQYQSGRWVVGEVRVPSVGAELHPVGAPDDSLTDGFWLGPDPDVARVRRVDDRDRPAVRLRANKNTSALMLETRQPLPTLDGMLVSVSVVVRGQPGKVIALTLKDVADASGTAAMVTDQHIAAEAWTTLSVRRRMVHPSPEDNVSVGLIGADGGDWFEVRELDVFLGVVP